MIKNRPHRLDLTYMNQPLYFVTFAARDRRTIRSLDGARLAIERYGHRGIAKFSVALGRYIIMPDHVHLFVRGGPDFTLSSWVGGLKRAMSVAVKSPRLWQPGFFDHVLRSDESYADKWNYVRDNPVRAGLVQTADDWRYQGEIATIDRA
jgi:REP-associated tyrosine transposase